MGRCPCSHTECDVRDLFPAVWTAGAGRHPPSVVHGSAGGRARPVEPAPSQQTSRGRCAKGATTPAPKFGWLANCAAELMSAPKAAPFSCAFVEANWPTHDALPAAA